MAPWRALTILSKTSHCSGKFHAAREGRAPEELSLNDLAAAFYRCHSDHKHGSSSAKTAPSSSSSSSKRFYFFRARLWHVWKASLRHKPDGLQMPALTGGFRQLHHRGTSNLARSCSSLLGQKPYVLHRFHLSIVELCSRTMVHCFGRLRVPALQIEHLRSSSALVLRPRKSITSQPFTTRAMPQGMPWDSLADTSDRKEELVSWRPIIELKSLLS
jgi:hypothetical protein